MYGKAVLDVEDWAEIRRLRRAEGRVIRAGHAFIQNLRRGHYELGSDTDPKNRLTAAFTELAFAI